MNQVSRPNCNLGCSNSKHGITQTTDLHKDSTHLLRRVDQRIITDTPITLRFFETSVTIYQPTRCNSITKEAAVRISNLVL